MSRYMQIVVPEYPRWQRVYVTSASHGGVERTVWPWLSFSSRTGTAPRHTLLVVPCALFLAQDFFHLDPVLLDRLQVQNVELGNVVRCAWTSIILKSALVLIILVIVVKQTRKKSKYKYMRGSTQPSKWSEPVFSYYDRYWKLHNKYNRHASYIFHVPRKDGSWKMPNCDRMCLVESTSSVGKAATAKRNHFSNFGNHFRSKEPLISK